MGFSFLAPIFAAGLAALAVPLLVHLVHRERKDAIAFPSLMFIETAPYQHARRQRIRDWLLFVARCLIIALIVAAFTRPVAARLVRARAPGAGGREVVVLLDRSFSMTYGDRWAAAQRAVRQVIAGIGSSDRLTLVPFDVRASAVNEASADKLALRNALDSIKPSDAATKLGPAVALARRILTSSKLPAKELVVVSDFQRSAWDLGDDARVPVGTKLTPVDVATGVVSDRSVRAVETRRDPVQTPERMIVSARVVNVGPAAKGVGASLEVSGRVVDRRTVDLPADGGATISFTGVPVPDDPVPARVVLDADALTGDDAFHFLLSRAPTVPVLLVEHRDAPSDRGVFLIRAFAIGDQPAFDVLTVRSDRVTGADLAGRRLVVLSDAGVPAGIGAQRLVDFVRGGGGLLVALGERTSPAMWPAAARALLPAPIAAPVDRMGERGAVLGYLDRAHPALSVFGAARSGDLSAARFFRYRPIAAAEGVLARFDDGAAALVEHRVGTGRVLTWASTFDDFWTDLPRQSVFLPFVHQLARHASSYRDRRSSYAVGEAVDLRDERRSQAGGTAGEAATRFSVVAPGGARLAVGGPDAPSVLETREAGFYEVRPSGAPNERPRSVATNVAPAELEFAAFDPARLTNAVAPVDAETAAAEAADPAATLVDRERDQSIWWYLLIVVAIVLLAEGLLATRVTQRRLQLGRS